MSLHIALAIAPGGEPEPDRLATRLCEIWKQRGHWISLTSAPFVDADCVLLHIDSTIIEPEMIPKTPPTTLFLNKNVVDISKRRVSRNLVSPEDEYAGPVIVKTNDNFAGVPIWPETKRHRIHKALRHAANEKTWRYVHMIPRTTYPILQNKSEVPGWVWRREDIVVERFMAEMEDDLYVLRVWIFLGDREYGAKLYSRVPVVKSRGLVRYEYLTEFPEELRRERERLGFDFGKFDYVHENGKPQLLDANSTPSIHGDLEPSPNLLNLADALPELMAGRS